MVAAPIALFHSGIVGLMHLRSSTSSAWRTQKETTVTSTSLRSGKVEAIVVHDLVPRSHEITHELLFRVLLCIKLGDGSELGVRAEDEVDGGAAPLDLARLAVATLVHVLIRTGCLPFRAHVEQVHEEVIGQRPRPLGEDTVSGLPGVSIQGAHAAD